MIILNFKCCDLHCFACTSPEHYYEAILPLRGDGAWTSSWLISRSTYLFWTRRQATFPIPDMSSVWLLAQCLGWTRKVVDFTVECPCWMWPEKEKPNFTRYTLLNNLSLETVSYFAIILQLLEILTSKDSFFETDNGTPFSYPYKNTSG